MGSLTNVVSQRLQFLNELLLLVRRHSCENCSTRDEFRNQFRIILPDQCPRFARERKHVFVLRMLQAERGIINVKKNQMNHGCSVGQI